MFKVTVTSCAHVVPVVQIGVYEYYYSYAALCNAVYYMYYAYVGGCNNYCGLRFTQECILFSMSNLAHCGGYHISSMLQLYEPWGRARVKKFR